MHDAAAVGAELKFTGLELVDGASQIGGDGACLGVGHQAAGTEHPAQLGHLGHHVRGGDQQVEVHLALGDLIHQIVVASEIGAGSLGGSHGFTAGDHGNADRLARAVGQGHGGAQLLVGVLRIDPKAHVGLQGFVKLGVGVGQNQLNGLEGAVAAVFDLGADR